MKEKNNTLMARKELIISSFRLLFFNLLALAALLKVIFWLF